MTIEFKNVWKRSERTFWRKNIAVKIAQNVVKFIKLQEFHTEIGLRFSLNISQVSVNFMNFVRHLDNSVVVAPAKCN